MRRLAQTGDVFFTAGNSLFSRLIRFFTGSRVSHTGVFYWAILEGTERLMIAEYIEGVGFHSEFASGYFAKLKKKNAKFYYGRCMHKGALIAKRATIVDRIQAYSKGEYDMAGALYSLRGRHKDADYYCSEFVAEVFNWQKNASTRGFTPDDIAEKCHLFYRIR